MATVAKKLTFFNLRFQYHLVCDAPDFCDREQFRRGVFMVEFQVLGRPTICTFTSQSFLCLLTPLAVLLYGCWHTLKYMPYSGIIQHFESVVPVPASCKTKRAGVAASMS